MSTKLHINFHQGILEVEGEETFVRFIYSEFKSEIVKRAADLNQNPAPANPPAQDNVIDKQKAKKESKRSKTSDEPKIDKNLNLTGGNGTHSLKEFVAQCGPKTNLERNVVFVEYLKETMQISAVTIDHVWTCYYSLGIKYPGNPQQSIYDTSSKGWLNVPSLNNISLSIHGKNLIREKLNPSPKAA